MSDRHKCDGIRFGRVVKGLVGTETRFVSAVGVDRELFGGLASMNFLVEFGVEESGMYSLVPLYDYENGFLVGFLWSGEKRRDEIRDIVWRNHFARGKYPKDFFLRVFGGYRTNRYYYYEDGPKGLLVSHGSIKPARGDPRVKELVKFMGFPRLRLIARSDGSMHSLSAIGFSASDQQLHMVLHASPVIGCIKVREGVGATKTIWLYGTEKLHLTEGIMKHYIVAREEGGVRIRYEKTEVKVAVQMTGPLMRGRGGCGIFLLLTPLAKRIHYGFLPLVIRGRVAESAEKAEKILIRDIIPSIFVLAADMAYDDMAGCVEMGLRRICYKKASPIDLAWSMFEKIYEKIRNTISHHLISSKGVPYRGLEPEEAFNRALDSCEKRGYCLVDTNNQVLVATTVGEALRLRKESVGDEILGEFSRKSPIAEYLKAIKNCEVIV